jgi:hypothetical protein
MSKQFIMVYVHVASNKSLPAGIVVNTSQILFLKPNPQVMDEYVVFMSEENTKKVFEICLGENAKSEILKNITTIFRASDW